MSRQMNPNDWHEIAADLRALRETPTPSRLAGSTVDRWLAERQHATTARRVRPWLRLAAGMAVLAVVWVGPVGGPATEVAGNKRHEVRLRGLATPARPMPRSGPRHPPSVGTRE